MNGDRIRTITTWARQRARQAWELRLITIEVIGLALLSAAAWLERPSAGVAIAGVSLLFIAYSAGD